MKTDDMREIKPGLSVDIVVNTDYVREITDVRRAVIYDMEKNKIIVSQTNPPFTRFYLNKGVTVTYFIRREGELTRVGYFGRLTDIINYNLHSSKMVQAVVIELKSGREQYDLRMHFRVRPTSDSNLELRVRGERVSIIDISIGGARFSHKRSGWMIGSNEILKVLLIVDGEEFEIDTKVLRAWSPYTERRQEFLEYVSVQFLNIDRRLNYLLGGKIFEIERELRSKI
ncbi:MAG: PilZ domain-containing protein [Syntrophales bacterium]